MLHQTQAIKKANTTEVMIPADQSEGAIMPSVMAKSPLDWPIEVFTQALERREINRKALLKWIESNLKIGIDYGQIHVVGKNKCKYARDGRQQDCPNKWSPGFHLCNRWIRNIHSIWPCLRLSQCKTGQAE